MRELRELRELVLSDGKTTVWCFDGGIYIDTEGAFEAAGIPVTLWPELRSTIDRLIAESTEKQ